MKTALAEILVVIAIGTLLQGCAAIPFLPMIASVPGMLMSPMSSKSKPVENKPMTNDAEIQQAIVAPHTTGDRGVDIPQQDRVTFQPAAEGSIPMRVGAVDIVSDEKARSVGDIVTVNVVESMSSEAKAATSLSIRARLAPDCRTY